MIKVLIADDETKVIQLIRYLVDWTSFEMEIIGTVNDGENALKMIAELNPDLVITDIRMPIISGVDLVAKSHEQGFFPFFVIVSGYCEFDYAQRAIQLGVEDYLLKPLKKKDMERVLTKVHEKYLAKKQFSDNQSILMEQLERSRKKDKNNLLTDLLVKHNSSVTTMSPDDFFEEYNCSFDGSLAECVIAHIYTGDIDYRKASAEEYDFIISKFRDDILQRLSPICIDVLNIIWNEEIICLINHNQQDTAVVLEELRKLKINVLNYRNMFPALRIAIAVSKPITSIKLIEESFADARHTLAKRFVNEDQLVLVSDDYFPAIYQDTEVITASLRNELNAKIELLDLEGYHSVLKKISAAQSAVENNPHIIEQTYNNLVDTFLYGLKTHEHFLGEQIIDKAYLMRGYSSLYSVDELCHWFSETTDHILCSCASERRAQEEKPIRLAKQFIQEHYNEPITLETVSGQVGFNPAYMSTVFKKATGQNFMDYLKEVRIEHAKELLLHSDMDVQMISASVGYSDVKYFSRLFRKITLLTPSEYRKMYG